MIIMVSGIRCEVQDCIICGVPYTVPEAVIAEQRKNGGYHSCPNGHSQGWGKGNTEFDRVSRERDRLKQREAQLRDELAEQMAKVEEARKEAARLAKRASVGVCPCCTRTFTNMARHMKTKHPDYNVVPLKAAKA